MKKRFKSKPHAYQTQTQKGKKLEEVTKIDVWGDGGLEAAAWSRGRLRINNPDWCKSVGLQFRFISANIWGENKPKQNFVNRGRLHVLRERVVIRVVFSQQLQQHVTGAQLTWGLQELSVNVTALQLVVCCEAAAPCWLRAQLQPRRDATLRNHKRLSDGVDEEPMK